MMQERGSISSSRGSVMPQASRANLSHDGVLSLERTATRFQCEICCDLTGRSSSGLLHGMVACYKGL